MSLNPFSQAPWVISVAASNVDDATDEPRRVLVERPDLRQLAGGHDRRRRPHRLHRRPDRRLPPRRGRARATTSRRPARPRARSSRPARRRTTRTRPRAARPWPRRTSPAPPPSLLQANPNLTPDQVRMALQATADPVARFGDGPTAPFWQVGYGHVDLAAAVSAVTARNWSKDLPKAPGGRRRARPRGGRLQGRQVRLLDVRRAARSPSPARPTTRSFSTAVGLGVTHLKVALVAPVARRRPGERHGVHGHGQGRERPGARHDDRGADPRRRHGLPAPRPPDVQPGGRARDADVRRQRRARRVRSRTRSTASRSSAG